MTSWCEVNTERETLARHTQPAGTVGVRDLWPAGARQDVPNHSGGPEPVRR